MCIALVSLEYEWPGKKKQFYLFKWQVRMRPGLCELKHLDSPQPKLQRVENKSSLRPPIPFGREWDAAHSQMPPSPGGPSRRLPVDEINFPEAVKLGV